jgi:spore coat polysaccharide biosynthesis protein SpsF
MPRVIASVEARMSSSRLPGKVLADIGGEPALTRLVRRLRRAGRVDGIVLATSENPADDALASWAEMERVRVFRGSEDDVLGRVVAAHAMMESEIIVEICGDMPLLDPEVVDMAVETFLANQCDVVTATAHPSFPQGSEPQVFRYADLAQVEFEVHDPAVREHVSLYFYEHPERYRTIHLAAPPRWRMPEQRLQLDYPEDLALICAVYSRLAPLHGDDFGLEEIVSLLRADASLRALNAGCVERAAR